MISVYGGTRGPEGLGRPEGPDVPDYPDIPVHPELPGHTHRYWIAGSEILDDGLINTAWQPNR